MKKIKQLIVLLLYIKIKKNLVNSNHPLLVIQILGEKIIRGI